MSEPVRLIPWATVLGALAVWLLLLEPRAPLRALGAVLGAVALGMIAVAVPGPGDWLSETLLVVLAAVTVVSAAAAVTLRRPVYCALWFGMSLVGTAGLFLFQGAQFLAVATIVVYAGAILVTFLFVLMLAAPSGRTRYDRVSFEALLSASAGAVLVGLLTMIVVVAFRGGGPQTPGAEPITPAQRSQGVLAADHVARIGGELFGRYLLAVEAAGVLLLAALVGAAVIVGHHKARLVRSVPAPGKAPSPPPCPAEPQGGPADA